MLKNKVFQLVPVLGQEPVNVRRTIANKIGKSEAQLLRYYNGTAIMPDDTKIAIANVITALGVKCKVSDLEPIKMKAKKVKS